MQISKMYAIHDEAAGAFLAPFFMQNDLLAIRAFAALINDPNHLFSNSPHDFVLFEFASFDVTEGTLTPEPKPRPVRAGIALVKRNPNSAQTTLPLEET